MLRATMSPSKGQPDVENMTVAVTGASGHVGANLVRTLLAQGRRVRVLIHEESQALMGLDVERIAGDVRDPAALDRAFAGARAVFHLAARISISGDHGGRVQAVNATGTRNVVAACRRAGAARLVHFSSIHAFSPLPAGPIDETRALNDVPDALAYERSKVEGERAVLAGVAEGLDAVIVNPTAILGPHDYRPSPMGTVLLDLYRRRFPALVDGGFNWVDVRDVVAGALAAEQKGRRGERYILSGRWTTFAELAALVSDITRVPTPRMVTPMWLARVGAGVTEIYGRVTGAPVRFTGESLKALRHWREVSCDKARRELGYEPRPLHDTVADTFSWFHEAGVIPAVRTAL